MRGVVVHGLIRKLRRLFIFKPLSKPLFAEAGLGDTGCGGGCLVSSLGSESLRLDLMDSFIIADISGGIVAEDTTRGLLGCSCSCCCSSSEVRDEFKLSKSVVETDPELSGQLILSLEAASFKLGRLRFRTRLNDFWNWWKAAVGVFGRGLILAGGGPLDIDSNL